MKKTGSRRSVLRKNENSKLEKRPRKSFPSEQKSKKIMKRRQKNKTMNHTPFESMKSSRNPSMSKIPNLDILKTIEKLHTPVLRASSFFQKLHISPKASTSIHEDSTKETDRLTYQESQEFRSHPCFYRTLDSVKKYPLNLRIPGNITPFHN